MKKRTTAAVVGIAAVALVGGTFAYFTQTATIDNPFDTARYETVVTEDFKPEDGEDWKPGAEVNKDVYVHNTGDQPVVVRVKFEDIWSRDEKEFKTLDAKESMDLRQEEQYDGETDEDGSVVEKKFANEDKWSELQEDGYFYYLGKLEPGQNTDAFLDSVRLMNNVDMGKLRTQYYFTKNEEMPIVKPEDMEGQGWEVLGEPQMPYEAKVTVPDDAKHTAAVTRAIDGMLGYSDADYTLRITIETVQATDKAVLATFGNGYDANIYDGWGLYDEDLDTGAAAEPTEPTEPTDPVQ